MCIGTEYRQAALAVSFPHFLSSLPLFSFSLSSSPFLFYLPARTPLPHHPLPFPPLRNLLPVPMKVAT